MTRAELLKLLELLAQAKAEKHYGARTAAIGRAIAAVGDAVAAMDSAQVNAARQAAGLPPEGATP